MNKRRVKCPYCEEVSVNIPDDWTDEKVLQKHFDTQYYDTFDLKYGKKSFKTRNPCFGKKVEISEKKIEKYTEDLLEGLEAGGVVI